MTTIGRYRIEDEVGRGAMGIVYRALDPELNRVVAVKTYHVPPGLDAAQQEEFRSRFRREAHAAAALSHPGIVTIFDAGEDAETGVPFLAMEFVPGRSLERILEDEGRLSVARVAEMAPTLAEALASAHAAGIVHRDIKPANLLVHDREGTVKIADFGVARIATSKLTRSGSSLGSPAYMSPEQIRGRTVDGRADLFSLAVILYEALCGRRPFAADDIPGLVYAVAHEDPTPVTIHAPALPRSLDGFFARALAKDPGDRFQDASQLAEAFQRVIGPPEGDALPVWAVESESPEPIEALAVDGPLLAVPEEPATRSSGPGRRTALLVAAAGFALMVFGVAFFGRNDAQLLLDGKSRVDGELTVLVDGKPVYERALVRHGSRAVVGPEYENFEALIDVRSGKREVEMVLTPETGEPFRSSLVVEVGTGETRRLRLVAGRALGASVSFRAD